MARITKAPDERRSELIEAAQVLFFTKGYERTSINDIVKTVGVAKGLFYYYFDSKQDLLAEMADAFADQGLALLQSVIDDPDLSALEKWHQSFQRSAKWKTAQKEQMIALLEMMARDENALMYQRMRERTLSKLAPEIGRIVQQGVDEGVFETEFVMESAEIAVTMMHSISNALSDYILNPFKYDDAIGLARRKLSAIQSAIERTLGATPGSLPLLDDKILESWFA